ncbi:hypothetical protein K474DRAFT_1752518 [Panus rudis PR-1116 ss-1]|nr:hypothetical protein K474DRAFT_1752518 [Panus rudis PR-1116 ss-1]
MCTAPAASLADSLTRYPFRDLDAMVKTLSVAHTNPKAFLLACKEANIKPIFDPFWVDLPYCDIFLAITPDILHQLLQGVIKHLISWIKTAYSTAEIDARCRHLPPNHNIHPFMKGITSLSKLTGREHADIARILLGLVIDLPSSRGESPMRIVQATRALLDFLYLAQYPIHSSETLGYLEDALHRFHLVKEVFIELGIRSEWKLPKLHYLDHYRFFIELLGTPDNFSTEFTERLHEEFPKAAYGATNHRDEFPQMTLWQERHEKILRHEKYIAWCLAGCPPSSELNPLRPSQPPDFVSLAKNPSQRGVTFNDLTKDYGAIDFHNALRRFIVKHNNPFLSHEQVIQHTDSLYLQYREVSVFWKAHFWDDEFPRYRNSMYDYDVVHCRPSYSDTHNHVIPGRFDTVLVDDGSGSGNGIQGYHIGQVRVIFSLPSEAYEDFEENTSPPKYLAYVEWFTALPSAPHPIHGLYKISRAYHRGSRVASIIPVANIRRSIHLFPAFKSRAPDEWSSHNVLELCQDFYVNTFTDRHTFGTIY